MKRSLIKRGLNKLFTQAHYSHSSHTKTMDFSNSWKSCYRFIHAYFLLFTQYKSTYPMPDAG